MTSRESRVRESASERVASRRTSARSAVSLRSLVHSLTRDSVTHHGPVSPEILKQVKAIELRTRGLVGSLFAGEYRSVFRGQGMEFAEVRAYEHGDDFRAIDWNVSARLASPYVKTFTEERELTLMLVVDQSGSTRFGEPLTKAALAVEVGGGARAGGGLPERPGRRAALLRRGGAGHPAAQGPPARAARHPRPGRVPARRPANQPRRQPVLCQPAAASPQHRRRALRFPRRRLGAAAAPPRGAARGRGDHRGRPARARPARRRAGSRCRMPSRAAGCWWTPGAATSGAGWPTWQSSDGRSGPAPWPRPARTRCLWRPAATTRFLSDAPSPSAPAGSIADDRIRGARRSLLQGPQPTVGDTIWLTRTVAVPPGYVVRAATGIRPTRSSCSGRLGRHHAATRRRSLSAGGLDAPGPTPGRDPRSTAPAVPAVRSTRFRGQAAVASPSRSVLPARRA